MLTSIFDFGNAYFDASYHIINMILYIPIFIAIVFFMMFWANDSKATRKNLWIGMLLVLAAVILLCFWAIIYICAMYRYNYVYLGSGPMEDNNIVATKYSNYMDEEKGGFILAECFWALIEGSLFLYFFFVTLKYEQTWLPEEPVKEDEGG